MNHLIVSQNEEYLMLKRNPHFEEVECVYDGCKQKFLRRRPDCISKKSLPYGVRGKNCVTCCPECSKLNGVKRNGS